MRGDAMRGTVRSGRPTHRRVDRALAWFAGIVVASSAAGVALGAALLLNPESPSAEAVVGVGDVRIAVPGRWLQARSGGGVSLALAAGELGLTDIGPSGEDGRILVHLVPADDAMDPAERPALLYARFLSAEASPSPGNLIRRQFRAGTPYEGESLYLTPPDGRSFAARCAEAGLPGQAECAVAFRSRSVEVRVGLPTALLPHGPAIIAHLAERLAGAGGQPAEAGR